MDRRTLAYAVIAIGCMLPTAIALPWFTLADHESLTVMQASGMFGDTVFGSAIVFSIIVLYELGSLRFGYEISQKRIRWGYTLGSSVLMATAFVAYLDVPKASTRTWSPLLMVIGAIAGIAVGYRVSGGTGTGSEYIGEYKPIVIEKKK